MAHPDDLPKEGEDFELGEPGKGDTEAPPGGSPPPPPPPKHPVHPKPPGHK